MGKKTKVGKARKDKYYKLAKEIGYRSRSAFKLLQLNRKFEFLQRSRVLVDLCAAPGGWLQVASKTMPVSGVVIGVDLHPIRAIPRVKTFVADITTEKCRTQLKKELHHWRVDCFLHDGAPNVGTNWLLDAHTQARLTLQSLKLACEFLKKGGWFVTKVFRSRDYQSLVWVFHQLFHKVHATKPQASRHESAEIFVVCQGFIAPDKIDPKFFNPKHIFKELPVQESEKKLQILQDPMKARKKKAVGYEDDETISMHHRVNMSDFLNSEEPVKLLNDCNELVFDVEDIESHRLTTNEIKECAKDIKVLGRKDVRTLLSYHKNMRTVLENAAQLAKEKKEAEEKERAAAEASQFDGVQVEEINDEDLKTKIEELKEEERKEARKKQKAATRRKQKITKRLQKLNLMQTATEEDDEGPDRSSRMFKVKNIKDVEHLSEVGKGDTSFMEKTAEEEEEEEIARLSGPKKPSKFVRQGEISDPAYPQDEEWGYSDSEGDDDIPSDLEEEEKRLLKKQRSKIEEKAEGDDSDSDLYSDSDDEEKNPLVTDLYDPEERARRKTSLWFSKGAFEGLEGEADEDLEITQMSEHYQKMGGSIKEKPAEPETSPEEEEDSSKTPSKRRVSFNTTVFSLDDSGNKQEEELSEDDGMSDDDDDDSPPLGRMLRKGDVDPADESSSSDESDDEGDGRGRRKGPSGPKEVRLSDSQRQVNKSTANKDGFEIVSSQPAKEIVKLDPTGLAIGEQIATSKKRRREIIEHGYNRYVYGEERGLPTWFIRDEKRHCRRLMPVTKEQVETYKARLREINARPIKKVAEAKARKKLRYMRRVEKLKKKAEAIGDSADVSEKEKFLKLKDLYKKAGLDGKRTKQVTYVVAKKGLQGKRVKRPKGLKGPYKVVDPRMKTDMRAKKAQEARKKKQKKRRN